MFSVKSTRSRFHTFKKSRFGKIVREQLFLEQKGKCPNCNVYMIMPTQEKGINENLIASFDHIIPISQGGTNELKNLRLICRACNCAKGTWEDPNRNKKHKVVIYEQLFNENQ